jgi:hypothetical protein
MLSDAKIMLGRWANKNLEESGECFTLHFKALLDYIDFQALFIDGYTLYFKALFV